MHLLLSKYDAANMLVESQGFSLKISWLFQLVG